MFGKKNRENDGNWRQYFSIYDSKIGQYRPPILAINEYDVLRSIENLMKDPSQSRHELLLNAEDFSVFHLGEFNIKTGELKPTTPIAHVANLHDIRSSVQRTQPPATPGTPQGLPVSYPDMIV